jgi:hypothetical protein
MREGNMSGHEHLSEDSLLDAIYGIATKGAEAHLGVCAECARRLSEWHGTRSAEAESADISGEFLAAQRKQIYARIERPLSKQWLWAPGLAGCALALVIFAYHPAPKAPREAHADMSDAQLFGEVYSMEQSLEPAAVAPARALFEEQQ